MEEGFHLYMVNNLRILVGLLLSASAWAQIENVRVVGTTSTQAVIAYTAPDEGLCSVEAGPSPSLQPNLHDINGHLFPEGGLDSRPGSIQRGRERLIVLGRRTAERAQDGKRYSRAMEANTEHHFAIYCGESVARGSFRTQNIPTGMNYSDPLSLDPARPGQYAWPAIDWMGRSVSVIDPLTGLRLHRLTSPGDRLETNVSPFRSAHSWDGSWRNPSAAVNNNDNGASASHIGANQGYLLLDARQGFYQGGTHDNDGGGLAYVRAKLNAWCEELTCEEAGELDRTLMACLTVNGVSCATNMLEAVVKPCVRNCGGDAMTITFGDETPMLAAWGGDVDFDISHAQNRAGLVRREGNTVRWLGGHKFSLRWTAGSRITLNGVEERIARVNSEELLMLEGAPSTAPVDVRYEASNFGLLVRRKTVSAVQFNVQYSLFDYAVAAGTLWDASGDGESQVSCSEKTVPGPDGEQGYHCAISNSLYWFGQESGRVSNLGVSLLPERNTPGDGWRGAYCGSVFWEAEDPNRFYCKATDQSNPSNDVVLRVTYYGDNRDAGATSLYGRMRECTSSFGNQPCFTFVNITPSSSQRTLTSQLRSFHPDAATFIVRTLGIIGRQGRHLLLMARRDNANDTLGFLIAFDPVAARIVAAAPSWKSWPLRWSGLHGGESVGSPQWALIPSTYLRGPATGIDFYAGNGPYRTRIASGAIGTAGLPCPLRPANSPVAAAGWPSGNECLTVTVEGEPCDPSPAAYSKGSVRVVGGNSVITGSDTDWNAQQDGMTILINGKLYRFSYLTSTTARLSPPPEESFEGAYVLTLEPINNSKCASPLHAYLQDAEPGDVFCGNPDPNASGCGLYRGTEWFQLLVKNGNTWTLQRRFGENGQTRQHPANTYLIVYPPTCNLGKIYPCASSMTYWNFLQDPLGRNEERTTLLRNAGDPPTGHGSTKPGLEVFSIANEGCSSVDGEEYSCYGFRRGVFPDLVRQPYSVVANNPAFYGRLGFGSPNGVDSHPTVPLLSQMANAGGKNWFLDARPVLGDNNFSGNRQNPATNLEGDLYRFRPDQLARLRRQSLPTMAFCGHNPLRDVSGPESVIDGTGNFRFTYCVAGRDNECRPGSQTGDAYVNCPFVSRPYCQYPGVGVANSDTRDICLGDNGAYNQAVTQIGVDSPGLSGAGGRVLTYALSRYRFTDPFWNVKTTPDGRWMFIRVPWLEGKYATVLAAQIPPMPESPVSSFEMQIRVTPPEELAVAGVGVEFGYTPEFHCTSRNEGCVRGQHTGREYSFVSLPWTPQPCAGSCEITLPVVPDRVIYWRARYYDAEGNLKGLSEPSAGVTTR